MWSASEIIFSEFRVPVVRGRVGCDHKIKQMVVAFQEGGKAELCLHIAQCRRKRIQDRLEALGATHVIIHSFPRYDRSKLAGAALDRVLKLAESPEMTLYMKHA
jgi:hypothetical protein